MAFSSTCGTHAKNVHELDEKQVTKFSLERNIDERPLAYSYKHRREVLEWERDEDEGIKEHVKMQSAIDEKRTNIEKAKLKLSRTQWQVQR